MALVYRFPYFRLLVLHHCVVVSSMTSSLSHVSPLSLAYVPFPFENMDCLHRSRRLQRVSPQHCKHEVVIVRLSETG